jgi:hypothetical protein
VWTQDVTYHVDDNPGFIEDEFSLFKASQDPLDDPDPKIGGTI